jgi:hypothetical protein
VPRTKTDTAQPNRCGAEPHSGTTVRAGVAAVASRPTVSGTPSRNTGTVAIPPPPQAVIRSAKPSTGTATAINAQTRRRCRAVSARLPLVMPGILSASAQAHMSTRTRTQPRTGSGTVRARDRADRCPARRWRGDARRPCGERRGAQAHPTGQPAHATATGTSWTAERRRRPGGRPTPTSAGFQVRPIPPMRPQPPTEPNPRRRTCASCAVAAGLVRTQRDRFPVPCRRRYPDTRTPSVPGMLRSARPRAPAHEVTVSGRRGTP